MLGGGRVLSSVGSEGFFRLQRGLRWRSLIRVTVAEEEGSHRCRMLQTERRTNEREREREWEGSMCWKHRQRSLCFLIAFGGSLLKPTKGGLPQALVGKVPEHLVDQIWRSKKTGRLDLRRSRNNVMTATCRRRLARSRVSRVLLKPESQLPIARHPSHPCCKERGSRLCCYIPIAVAHRRRCCCSRRSLWPRRRKETNVGGKE